MVISHRRKRSARNVAITVAAVAALAIFMYPMFVIVTMAFKPPSLATSPVLVFQPSLDNFIDMYSADFAKCLVNSLIIASGSAALVTVFSCLAAYALSRFNFRGKKQLNTFTMMMRALPVVAFVIPIFVMISKAGIYDTWLGQIFTRTAIDLTFAMWVLRSFFDSVPIEVEESAMIDGCSRLGVLVRISIPLAAPGIAVAAIFSFIFSWNDFAVAIVTTGYNTKTLPVYLSAFNTQRGLLWGPLAAGVVVSIIPTLLLALAIQRYIVKGLSLGAVKG